MAGVGGGTRSFFLWRCLGGRRRSTVMFVAVKWRCSLSARRIRSGVSVDVVAIEARGSSEAGT